MTRCDQLIYVFGSTSNASILYALFHRKVLKRMPWIFWTEMASFVFMALWYVERNSYRGWMFCYWASVAVYAVLVTAVLHYRRTSLADWLPVAYTVIATVQLEQVRIGFQISVYHVLEWFGIGASFLMAFCLERGKIRPRS